MNKKLAIIKDGIVVNYIVWDDQDDFIPDPGYVGVFTEHAGPGWAYDGTNFIQPETIEEEI